jgi:uncharacterized RDD family membrane protein YckC
VAYCQHCGQQTADGARFCSSCGADQTARAVAATAAPTTWQPTAPVQSTWPGQTLGLPQGGQYSLADPGQRLAARLIDIGVLIGGLVVIGIVIAILGNVIRSVGFYGMYDLLQFLPLLLLIVGALGYEVFFTATRGQTVGKMAMGIQVVDTATGRPPGWGLAFVRWLIPAIMAIVPFLPFLDALWLLWDENRQCLHDKTASTLVIRMR